MSDQISKTQRILSVYHLLNYCEEVSMQELTEYLHRCRKTFSRDISMLRKAGVAVHYSRRRQAFVLEGKCFDAPEYPKSKSERRYMKKLIRLFIIMDDMPDEDCDQWYAVTFPETSKRTMQRDFATLNSIGYTIRYERSMFNSHDAGFDLPPRHYYCDRPNGAYELIL